MNCRRQIVSSRCRGVLLCAMLAGLCAVGQAADPADAERQSRIQSTIKRIEEECRSYGQGDWSRWMERTAAFREELTAKLQRCPADRPIFYAPGDPVQFEACADVQYLRDAGEWEPWLKQRTVLGTVPTISRWLKKRGIDLVLVPVPKMTEVYPDRVVSATPEERIAAPQMRRLLLELAKADIEVVDLLPELLLAREQSQEPLALPNDSHWSPRSQRIASTLIADRLKRYAFVKAALAQPPMFKEVQVQRTVNGCWKDWISPALTRQMSQYTTKAPFPVVLDMKGHAVQAPDASPVLIIGDSFPVSLGALGGPGAALDAVLSKDLNLAVSNRAASAMIAANIVKDFIREPELLAGRKVIVWVLRNDAIWASGQWGTLRLPE